MNRMEEYVLFEMLQNYIYLLFDLHNKIWEGRINEKVIKSREMVNPSICSKWRHGPGACRSRRRTRQTLIDDW